MLTMISKLGFCLDLIYNLLFDFLFGFITWCYFENLFFGLKIRMAIFLVHDT
jgi:hypothetical protein